MSAKVPIISVGMPVYNGEGHLSAAIESILRQTFQDFELILSDNASTDGTEGICRRYAAGNPRVRYYRNIRNLGAQANYNAVFRHARGRYFKWASSNDVCDPRFLEACLDALATRPDTVLAYPRTRLVRDDSGNTEDYPERIEVTQARAGDRFRAFLDRVYLNNVMNGLIRSEILRKTPLMRTYLSSDVVLMAELALHGKFTEVPDFLFFRRMDPSSATSLRSRQDIIRHYDPRRTSMVLQRWRFHLGCLSAVVRTPVPAREKACLYRFLWRRFLRDRGYLARDLREAAKA